MFKASLFAASLLSTMYVGLTYIASYYNQFLPPQHLPEERLSAISNFLLGPYGGLLSCIAVAMACLTTAILLYPFLPNILEFDLLRGKSGTFIPLLATLALSILLANLGFMGIANLLSPVLQVLCPGLILLECFQLVKSAL